MRIQLWSYNYAPEPTGIGPVSRTLAEHLAERGHKVTVVAAHPHYPSATWGTRLRPYRERRNGIDVIRLPLWIGRESRGARYRQELTYMIAQALSSPLLPSADLVISASPCFPALLPALAFTRARRIPWLIWLHDILPDGATATGLVQDGMVLSAARWLERTAYKYAARIVVLSNAFTTNLAGKGVPKGKIRLIYDPATRTPMALPSTSGQDGMRILSMGNIGFSQGLAALVEAFERDSRMEAIGARLVITGNGVAAADVRKVVRSDRVEMLGVVDDATLELQLQRARIALVSQHYVGSEFNIPSKLMNFMAYGIPVLAAVNPLGEVARIVGESNSGWIVDSSDPRGFPQKIAELAANPATIDDRAMCSYDYAQEHFAPDSFADAFERVLQELA